MLKSRLHRPLYLYSLKISQIQQKLCTKRKKEAKKIIIIQSITIDFGPLKNRLCDSLSAVLRLLFVFASSCALRTLLSNPMSTPRWEMRWHWFHLTFVVHLHFVCYFCVNRSLSKCIFLFPLQTIYWPASRSDCNFKIHCDAKHLRAAHIIHVTHSREWICAFIYRQLSEIITNLSYFMCTWQCKWNAITAECPHFGVIKAWHFFLR